MHKARARKQRLANKVHSTPDLPSGVLTQLVSKVNAGCTPKRNAEIIKFFEKTHPLKSWEQEDAKEVKAGLDDAVGHSDQRNDEKGSKKELPDPQDADPTCDDLASGIAKMENVDPSVIKDIMSSLEENDTEAVKFPHKVSLSKPQKSHSTTSCASVLMKSHAKWPVKSSSFSLLCGLSRSKTLSTLRKSGNPPRTPNVTSTPTIHRQWAKYTENSDFKHVHSPSKNQNVDRFCTLESSAPDLSGEWSPVYEPVTPSTKMSDKTPLTKKRKKSLSERLSAKKLTSRSAKKPSQGKSDELKCYGSSVTHLQYEAETVQLLKTPLKSALKRRSIALNEEHENQPQRVPIEPPAMEYNDSSHHDAKRVLIQTSPEQIHKPNKKVKLMSKVKRGKGESDVYVPMMTVDAGHTPRVVRRKETAYEERLV